jgi:lipoprotein-anchoring transpeptidase ErfK/SrfK
MKALAAALGSAGIVLLLLGQSAGAAVVIEIDKSAQHMSVQVDGTQQYSWRVSTGLGGGPPAGTYRPQRLERHWFSRKFGMSPMPHSIFFHEGYAIHGTIYVSRLGHRASHGCVRLHPSNAATLFTLVRKEGLENTSIMINR